MHPFERTQYKTAFTNTFVTRQSYESRLFVGHQDIDELELVCLTTDKIRGRWGIIDKCDVRLVKINFSAFKRSKFAALGVTFSFLLPYHFEYGGLLLRMRQGNLFYGLFKSIADSLLTEEKRVECFCESDHCIVIDFFLLLDANDVLGAGLNEDLTDELAMARSYNDKFEHLAFLFVVPLNHFFKCKRTDQNTFTLFSL